jgi:hypothetical protein
VLIDPLVLRFYDWPKRPDLAVRLPCAAGLLIEPSAPTPLPGGGFEYGRVYEFSAKPKTRRLLWTIEARGLANRRVAGAAPAAPASLPPASPPYTRRELLREAAVRLQDLGFYRAAESIHGRLIAQTPADWQPYSDRAVCRALRGELDAAAADARAAIARRPTSRQPYQTLEFIAAARSKGKKP